MCQQWPWTVNPIHIVFRKIAKYWFQGLQGLINDKHRRYERISSIPDLILVSFIQASHFTHLHALMYFLLFFTFSFAWKEKLINSNFHFYFSNFVIVFEILLEQGNKKDSLQTLMERRLQFSFFIFWFVSNSFWNGNKYFCNRWWCSHFDNTGAWTAVGNFPRETWNQTTGLSDSLCRTGEERYFEERNQK